mgnify:CR=1 FL=1
MAKRSRSYKRSIDEMKRDSERAYHGMEKFPSEINPIFLNKPYSACEPILRGYMGKGKESINEGVKCREKAHGECQEGKG